MKTRLLNILKYSKQDYEMLALDLYYCWCMEHCYSIRHLQTLVGNQRLFSWFMREYEKREYQFLEYVKGYEKNTSTKEFRDLYDTTICTINYYPKALLHDINKEIKKAGVKTTHSAVQQHLN